MDPLTLVLLVLAGLFAGIVNTLAGGGSLLTLPALMEVGGLPVHLANGTNRVGILLGGVSAVGTFRRSGLFEGGMGASTVVPALIGAVAGAQASLALDEDLFRKVVGVLLLAMLGLLLAQPATWFEEARPKAAWPWRVLGFLAIGFYGGFLQAGVGLFLILGYVGLDGQDLVRANARKVALVLLYTVPALAAFVLQDAVAWAPGLALGVGSLAGGWLGARFTVSWGARWIRVALIGVVVISAARMLLA